MTTTSGKNGLSISEELTYPDGYSLRNKLTFEDFDKNVTTGSLLLLQTGDKLLLQNGGSIILEAS